ncbi:SIMPL domain-containing protein [bacterium]|nr:SIMPL domain-containing protein [bacterium]
MRKNILALLLSAFIVLPLGVLPVGAVDNQVEKGYISVSYTTEKEVSPDTVEFSVAVKTTDKKSLQEASAKNKEITNKIYNYLKSNINTAAGDYIKTSNYNATPVYNYVNNKKVFDKYEVSNNIVVHTKSIDQVSSLIDKSIQLGATNVNSLNFTLANKDNQCTDILTNAGKQIRKRADVVAASVGSQVTGIKSIRTSCSLNQRHVNYAYSNMKLMRAAGASMDTVEEAAAPITNIEAGNITIYANVDAEFYLK